MHPVVDRIFEFDQLPAALNHLKNAQHFGKVCMRT
jgi:NADPH:quinone reductase-like Zn-dependent oxidoreductase